MTSQIKWYDNAAFDAPELNSPQPCVHGAGCVYTVKDADGNTVPGCCRFVHPGEEGNGRRIFPAREYTSADGKLQRQSACVRLTGRAGFYERRRLGLSWKDWCEKEGIPYTPNTPGEEPPRLVIARIGGPAADAEILTIVKRDGRTLVVPRDMSAHAPSRGGGGGGAPRPAPRGGARPPARRPAAAPAAPAAASAAAHSESDQSTNSSDEE